MTTENRTQHRLGRVWAGLDGFPVFPTRPPKTSSFVCKTRRTRPNPSKTPFCENATPLFNPPAPDVRATGFEAPF